MIGRKPKNKEEDAGEETPREQASPGGEAPSAAEVPVAAEAGEAEALPATEEIGREELERLRAAAAERDQVYDRFLRARADLENYRKRMAREMEEVRGFGIASFAREVLRIRDDLDRTLSAAQDGGGDVEALRAGVKLVRDQMDKVLGSFGVEAMRVQRGPFDPTRHEAVVVEVTDAVPDHTVMEEIEPGFTLHGRLLRAAKVKVSKAPREGDVGEGVEKK
ncbi:MAG: nucleotide exchange factor GrpE [Planctomycetota bacterium]